ncbi:hypothetical protein [Cyclobacterium xiamenense]|uniref:hypothetical protein n=1 Tax=Cyclobacterium xiamenense TaxID=1297121 RepID=UPI0035D02748
MNEQEKDRKTSLLAAIERCENPYVLAQVENLLKREGMLRPIGALATEYPILLQVQSNRDLSLQTGLKNKHATRLFWYQNLTAAPLFLTSILMLLITAAILNNFAVDKDGIHLNPFLSKLAQVYGFIWLLYLVDFLVILYLSIQTKTKIARAAFTSKLLSVLFPPLGMSLRHYTEPEKTWLPVYRWSLCNEGLLQHLKEKFSVPMIVVALLILPVLIIEWNFYDEVEAFLHTDLSFVLDMVQGFIWLAFALEFLLLVSITNDKFGYIKKNWIDLLIIVLPFISFVRTLRIFKVARLTHLARGYKLRALLMKARQGLIITSFFFRVLAVKPDFQLKKLKKKLDQNQAERESIEEELLRFALRVKQKNLR